MSADLIVRLPNWIGDCLMALPALLALRDRGLEPSCFGRAWAPPLLSATGLRVEPYPDGLLAGARALRAAPGERALLLTHSLSSAVACRLAGLAPLGYARDGRSPLLARRLPWPRATHEARRYWRLADAALRWLGRDGLEPEPPRVRLPLDPTARTAGAAALAAVNAGAQPTVLCPVATGTVHGIDKHWPHFAELAAALRERGHAPVVVAPPGRRDEIASRFPDCPLVADLALPTFAGLLAAAGRVVANDSGPMHLACAVGTPCVVPFGVTDPATTGAWSEHLMAVHRGDGWPRVDTVLAALGDEELLP